MRKSNVTLALLALSNLLGLSSFASDNAKKYDDMSIEELMDVKISVASNKAKTINQSPAAVTLITSDEIAHMGARDLTDVLRQVPGFSIGFEANSLVSPNFRGMGSSSKVLVMIDDLVINDEGTAVTLIGHRWPIDMIDRIEIMRGPGSIRYGGRAGGAVIKIITKNAKTSNGEVALGLGRQEYGSPENKLEGLYTQKGDTVSGSLLFSARDSVQSERKVTDSAGVTASMKDHSEFKDYFSLAQLNIGKFSAKVLTDDMKNDDITTVGLYNTAVDNRFDSLSTRMSYDFDLSQNVTLSPYIYYKYDNGWAETGAIAAAVQGEYQVPIKRYEGGLTANYEMGDNQNFLFGATSAQVNAKNEVAGATFPRTGTQSVSFEENALFVESATKFETSELTLGLRYDFGTYGDKLLPRIAYVKSHGEWDYKFVLSQGYRLPTVVNYFFNAPGAIVHAETTTLAEIEIDKKINEHSTVSMNLFSLENKQPIIFFFNITSANPVGVNYVNGTTEKSDGIELTYQHKTLQNSLKASFDYMIPDGFPPSQYNVPGYSSHFLAIANYKAALVNTYRISDQLFLSPSVIYEGPIYADKWNASAGALQTQKMDETIYANIVLEKKEFIQKAMKLSLAIYNVGDVNYQIGCGNHGEEAIPTQSRTYVAKIDAAF